MNAHGFDFLMGYLAASLVAPPLLRWLSTGRPDGWIDARRRKPAVGQTIVAYVPGHPEGVTGCTYTGPEGDASYAAEDAEVYWKPLPDPPMHIPRRAP